MNSSFFLVILPGLEVLALNELNEKLIHLNEKDYSAKIVKGGIELEINEALGYFLNIILKIPTRILLRIKTFRCRDLPKLHNTVVKINWNQFLHAPPATIEVSSHQSRLFNSKKITECLMQSFETYFKAYPVKKNISEKIEKEKIEHQIHIRFLDDTCTLSIDTSGELLYYREKKSYRGNAPIRETIASALFYRLNTEIQKLDAKQALCVVDPMCGSGNLLSESQHFFIPNNSRRYNFEFFPKNLKTAPPKYDFIANESREISYLGLDQDLELIAKIKEVKQNITFIHEDLFENTQLHSPLKTVVLTNPPYDKKIKTETANQKYYRSIIDRIINKYSPLFLGIIIPSGFNLDKIEKLKLIDKIKFRNGGIPVTFYLYKLEF